MDIVNTKIAKMGEGKGRVPGYGFLNVGSWIWVPGSGLPGLVSWIWVPVMGPGFLGVGAWV